MRQHGGCNGNERQPDIEDERSDGFARGDIEGNIRSIIGSNPSMTDPHQRSYIWEKGRAFAKVEIMMMRLGKR